MITEKTITTESEREEGIFTVEFPLLTQPFQEDILAKRMELARRVYNQTLRVTLDRYDAAMNSEPALSINAELKAIHKAKFDAIKELSQKQDENTDEEDLAAMTEKLRKKKSDREKELYKELNQIYFDIGLSKFGVPQIAQAIIKKAGYSTLHGKKGKKYKNLDTTVAATIGDSIYAAWQKKLFGNGTKLHFHRYGTVNSLCGKNNKTGIRVKLNHTSRHWSGEKTALVYSGLEIPIKVSDKYYETECFEHEIAYSRIVRRKIKGKDRYFIQILFRGTPPAKIDEKTGEFLHPMGKGAVSIAVGSERLAVISDKGFEFLSLSPARKDRSERIAEIQRALDASRRATNPDNFNEDGTVKRQGRKPWVTSNRYLRLKRELHDLMRKEAVNRKIHHYKTANYLLSLGDTFYISKTSFKEKQQRTKDDFVKISRKVLVPMNLDEAAPADAINVKIEDDTEKRYSNIIIPEKPFLIAKDKGKPLHIETESAEYIIPEDAVAQLNGAHTHPNEGKTIKDNAPAQLLELLAHKVDANGGTVVKETAAALCKQVKTLKKETDSAKVMQIKADSEIENICRNITAFVATDSEAEKNVIREVHRINKWACALYK